jgi:hypothetical protein
MHGFMNLLIGALIVHTRAGTDADVQRALESREPRQFVVDETALHWDGHSFSVASCADMRARLLRSVGSCSFEEPVAELRHLSG